MKLVCESIEELFESPDEISIPNLTYNRFGEPINRDIFKSPHFDDEDARPFWYDEGTFYLGNPGTVHPDGMRKEGFFAGRVWTDRKLISFWEYPDAEDFLVLIADLEKELGQPIIGKRWKVEVLEDGPWKGRDDDFQTKLVSVKDYKGSEKRPEEDLAQQHVKSPLLKAKKVPYGFGSKNPKYQEKRAWQMAAYEGVADKYGAQAFNLPNEEEEFNRQYGLKELGKPFVEANGIPIYKNPKSLEWFDKGVRGVVMDTGDLYLAFSHEKIIHNHIIDALKQKGLIQKNTEDWADMDFFMTYNFITVQRIWGKDQFGIGESYTIAKPKDAEERKYHLGLFKPYLEKAKEKNPQYSWHDEQVRVVAKGTLSPTEYQEFKTKGSGE